MFRLGCATLLLIAWISPACGDELVLLADLGSTSSISYLTPVGGGLFFSGAQPATGFEPGTSDGTPAGTSLAMDIYPGDWGSSPMHFGDLNGVALFQANDYVHDAELWRSAGTAATTWLVKDISTYHSSPAHLTPYDGDIFFYAIGPNGAELYRTDGTEAGTIMVKDINPGTGSSAPREFTEMGGILYFAAGDNTTGYELWRTDGTEEGTFLVKEMNPNYGSDPLLLTPVGSTLFFSADDGVTGRQLWKSDGTEAGTVMVKDVWPGPDMVAFNGELFFAGTEGASGQELWKSDGTEAGTVMVKDIYPYGSGQVSALVVAGGTLFFHACDYYTGRELWKSDGTAEGTVLVKDIWPGGSSSWPFALTEYCGKAYFAANDGTSGHELWVSDGTEEGTVLVHDFAPGSASSMQSPEFVISGGLLYFNVQPPTGAQLWTLDSGATGITEDIASETHVLVQNHPNPFNPATTIVYSVPVLGKVRLAIHDVSGRLVTTLLNDTQRPGEHSIVWDGRGEAGQEVAPGVYFARLTWNERSKTRRMVLTR